MFGKKKEEKKEGEKPAESEAVQEEQKKPEAAAASGAQESGDDGLEGLKNVSAMNEGTAEEAPNEEPVPAEEAGTKGQASGTEEASEPGKEDKAAEKEDASEAGEEEQGPEKEKAPEPEPEERPKKAHIERAAKEEPDEPEEKPLKRGKKDPETLKLRKQLETQKDTIKQLEKERADAMKKGDELAELIEDLSSEVKEVKVTTKKGEAQPAVDIEPRLRELQDRMASQMNELKSAIEARASKDDEEKKGEEEVAETMKKMFDKRLKELTEKLEEAKSPPEPREEAGHPGEVSGGLMAMGGGIELQNELDKVKKSIKDIATLLDAFKEEAENRFLAIDRELEAIEKIPDLEDKMQQFEKKLGSENVTKLRTLISSVDDIKEQIIPRIVKRTVEDSIEPFSKRLKAFEDAAEKSGARLQALSEEMNTDKKDIKALWKFEDRISKSEDAAGELRKALAETKALVKEADRIHLKVAEDRIKELLPKMIEAEASSLKKEFAGRFAFIDDKLQSAENMVSESHKEISELAVLKGEVDGIDDELDKLKDMDEKLLNRINALKEEDAELEDKIEALKTPKEIITELDNKTKDILEIREFFVRRTDTLEEMIKKLDERAVPVQKLGERMDTLAGGLAALRDAQAKLEKKTEGEKREIHILIRQHAEEKKSLEEKLREQRMRIATLVKEFR